jgi:hypothetical protein
MLAVLPHSDIRVIIMWYDLYASDTSRKGACSMNYIRYICAAAAAIALSFGWIAFAAEKTGDSAPVMFVQTAAGMSIKDGKLTLMSPSTTFSEGKMTGHMPCSKFIKAWSEGGDSFKTNPPKAVLSVTAPNGEQAKMEVTLRNPRFEGQNLIYDVSLINGSAQEGMQHEPALFTNDIRLASYAACDIYHCQVNGG